MDSYNQATIARALDSPNHNKFNTQDQVPGGLCLSRIGSTLIKNL